MSIRQFYPGGGILDGFRQIADFGAMYIDPFLSNESGNFQLTMDQISRVNDRFANDALSLLVVGLVGTVYTWSYLFPEQAAKLFFSEQVQAGGGYDLPWKPFRYMQLLVDVVPEMNAVGVGSVWEERLGN